MADHFLDKNLFFYNFQIGNDSLGIFEIPDYEFAISNQKNVLIQNGGSNMADSFFGIFCI